MKNAQQHLEAMRLQELVLRRLVEEQLFTDIWKDDINHHESSLNTFLGPKNCNKMNFNNIDRVFVEKVNKIAFDTIFI